jgi:hypothetical protein
MTVIPAANFFQKNKASTLKITGFNDYKWEISTMVEQQIAFTDTKAFRMKDIP